MCTIALELAHHLAVMHVHIVHISRIEQVHSSRWI
jgi:hypothetical protein